MHNKIYVAKIYVYAYGYRAKQAVKENAAKGAEIISEHKKELTVLGATSSAIYLASRAAGFKAGYAFANNPS